MKNYILITCTLLLALTNNLHAQRSNPLDSLLNLQYNSSTYTQVNSAIWKYNQLESQQIGTAVAFIQNLPVCWAMSPVYKYRMNMMYYKQLFGYYKLVAQEYSVFERIEREFKPVENSVYQATPTESISKLDSLLNLIFNPGTFTSTVRQIAKYDKVQSLKIDSAITYLYTIDYNWAMTGPYRERMKTLQYRQLHSYALLVEQEYMIWQKIQKEYPYRFIPNERKDDNIRVQPLKPVIYLYPEKEMDISVNLKFDSEELYTWPKVDANLGWSVNAKPDGMLTDAAGNEYPYLFWESETTDYKWVDFSDGFVIKAEDTENFLRDKLKYLGLNSREFTDFITFWAPRLRQNKYNLIRFETAGYNNAMPITVHPAPESMQRIFMVYKALDAPIDLPTQTLQSFSRKGYTVIEWGGMVMPDIIN
jgi:hypothetical protein